MKNLNGNSLPRIVSRASYTFLVGILLGCVLLAQTDDTTLPLGTAVDAAKKSAVGATGVTTQENPGLTLETYRVKQTAEFGGRIMDYFGSQSTWGTYVNLGSGPRLLEYSLSLHSPTHKGLLFDDLTFNNFGYGGDPNNVTRLQFSKGRMYDFDGSFRREKNYFDYNLLANPLNPSSSVPNVPILDSPHALYLTHRMTDVNLRLFPLSRVRFRLGYSRNVEEGTAFNSTHQGTEARLNVPTQSITDNYRMGVSVQLFARTMLNYDQFFNSFKGNAGADLAALPYTLAGGLPVDLGVSFNSAAGQPCATPILGTGFANPTCNGYFGYTRYENNRTSFPTEQVSFQSSYFTRLDLSGRFSYAKATNTMPSYDEMFSGLTTRTRQRVFTTTGPVAAERLAMNGDFGATVHLTDRLRLVDSFLYENERIPGSWLLDTNSLFGATLLSNPNVFSPATCPPPFTAATCPQHSASSSADVISDVFNNLLKQQRASNTAELEYDFTSRIAAYAGYRYENQQIANSSSDVQFQTFYPTLASRGVCAGVPLNPDGSCSTTVQDVSADFTEINTNSVLAGISARIMNKFRLHFDTRFAYADNAYTRISPRHLQSYRFTATYKPVDWVNISGLINILENRNTADSIGNLQHNRSYAITTQIAPQSARYGVDLTYDYSDIYSQTNICYVATPALTPSGNITCGTPYLAGVSLYSSLSNYGSGSVFFKPIPRMTVWAGYSATSAVGKTIIIDSVSPSGPLTYRYQLPTAALNFNLTKGLAFKSSWNYYDYHEYSLTGPTLPRNFRGNVYTLSLRYAF